jgi:phospholipid N-methyltransferase
MSTITFLKEFLHKPAEIGSLIPSSPFLGEAVARKARVAEADTVVELGPGTGSVTREVVKLLKPDATFFSMEVNPEFVQVMREEFPAYACYEDSAANVGEYLEKHGRTSCDSVVSGLPFASLPEPLTDELIAAIHDALRPGGTFATYTYVSSRPLPSAGRFRAKLTEFFGSYETSHVVWFNVPPAIVVSATK